MNLLIKSDKREEEDSKFKRRRIANKIMQWDSSNFISKNKSPTDQFIDEYYYIYRPKFIDTTFKQVDKDFIFRQFVTAKDSIWRHRFPHSKVIIAKKQKRARRYYYTIPLFSADKQIVIIMKEFYCGDLCAYGGTYIYKKVGDKWKLFAEVNKWMS